MVNSETQIHDGDTAVLSSASNEKSNKQVEIIDLGDDDEVVLLEDGPPSKRLKQSSPEANKSPAPEASPSNLPAPKEEPNKDELSDYTDLLNKLEEHVQNVLQIGTSADRKLLDTLLGAINVQVQKHPYAVRKLILEKQLVLPNSISFPPSQVVDAVIEHDSDMQISKVLTRMFGSERNKLTDAEKRERLNFKNSYPAPAMTRALMEVGQDLVQETTYSDIVHARNLPEMPKNVETYKQVAAQLKPVWEHLRDKNTSFKLKTYTCSACGFKTENMLLMSEHKQTLHISENKKIQCGMCPEYNTSETRMHRHYVEKHGLTPLAPEEPPSKIQCPLCDQDFAFKGQRDAHLKSCKREVNRLMTIQASRMPEHSAMCNRWLWSRPPADPIMQQNMRKQQQPEETQQRQSGQAPRLTPSVSQSKPPTLKSHPTPSPKVNQTSNSAANAVNVIMANQHLQAQLKSLGPAQKQQLEDFLRTKQSHLPANVFNALQSQLRNLQTGSQQSQTAKTITQANQLSNLAKMNPQALQMLARNLQQAQSSNRTPSTQTPQRKIGNNTAGSSSSPSVNRIPSSRDEFICEICDEKQNNKPTYLIHLQSVHSVLKGRNATDLDSGPPLACSRCRERFWSYDGLERHLVMSHSLVTSDLLAKAQNKLDGSRCKHCKKSFAFNILQHLASDHGAKLCSAEIMFSCDVCTFKCSSYSKLEAHLNESHPKNGPAKNGASL